MKKFLVLSAALLGTAVATQAGVDVHIGIPLPPLPRIVIGHPAPRVVVQAPVACAPARPVYYPPPPTCYAPPPVVVYPRYGHGHWRGHGHGHGHRHHGYYRR